jgi:hypothetical protein
MKTYKSGPYTAIDTGVGLFLAEDRTPFSDVQPFISDANINPVLIGDHQVLPYGVNNSLPEDLRTILDENHITPELLNKQTQLLWGQGPDTYTLSKENGKRVKTWVDDPEVNSWLKSWDYENYLLKAVIEFRHLNGHFTKYIRNRGARVGAKAFIAALEHVSSKNARLVWPGNPLLPVEHIIVGDMIQYWQTGLKEYPVFKTSEPFAAPFAMNYSNLYSFALDNSYSRPSTYGIFNWIKLASSLPKLLMNFNANSASIRYHIQSPALYWEQKRNQLKKNCELKNIPYTDELFEDMKDEIYRNFSEGLIGIEKAGKMITSETIYDDMGQEYVGWEVDVIDQKVKDYISAQVEIAKRADFEMTAGVGLHPALSNMSADGNLPSGSEQLYAFKLYLKTAVDIPESIVCKPINMALKANFPNKNIKIGFYHDTVEVEESVSPSNRIKNS